MMIVFDEYNNENARRNFTPLVAGFVLIGISVYPLAQTSTVLSFAHLLLFGGLFLVLLSLFTIRSASQHRQQYIQRINRDADLVEQVDRTLIFEFSKQGLYSEGQGNYTYLLWREIDRFYIKEEHIIIAYNNGTLYPISKLDVGMDSFEKIETFLKKVFHVKTEEKEEEDISMKKSNELLDD